MQFSLCRIYISDHPNFKGHVHFIGFSLGGIIAYDIASMQWFKEDGVPPWENMNMIVPRLDFKIQHVFTCGSPIAASLICRRLDYLH